jgi:hypothetical protein
MYLLADGLKYREDKNEDGRTGRYDHNEYRKKI